MSVASLIDRQAPTAEPSMRLDALAEIASLVAVLDDGRLVGLFVPEDVSTVHRAGLLSVRDAMRSPPPCCRADEPVMTVLDRVARLGLDALPAVDHHHRFLGMVARRRLADAARGRWIDGDLRHYVELL